MAKKRRTTEEVFVPDFLKDAEWDAPICEHCGCKIYAGCGLGDVKLCQHQDRKKKAHNT